MELLTPPTDPPRSPPQKKLFIKSKSRTQVKAEKRDADGFTATDRHSLRLLRETLEDINEQQRACRAQGLYSRRLHIAFTEAITTVAVLYLQVIGVEVPDSEVVDSEVLTNDVITAITES
jgi:hypothetical protein